MKYPRTYHIPWSPGATSDDKKLDNNWFSLFARKEIVITEKLDGENIHMTQKDCYARSDGAPTRSPWSRNIWDPRDGLYWKVKSLIGPDETIFGENLYGEHSITYNQLPKYFHLFAVNNKKDWYSWNDVVEIAHMMEIPTVPVLWKGIVESEEEVRRMIDNFMIQPSTYGDTKEGIVLRITDEFPLEDFPRCVCKWVRPNHVQTDEHWTKIWKKAELINKNYGY